MRAVPKPSVPSWPILRVVATTTGDKRTIQEYGAGGALLRSTVQLKKT